MHWPTLKTRLADILFSHLFDVGSLVGLGERQVVTYSDRIHSIHSKGVKSGRLIE